MVAKAIFDDSAYSMPLAMTPRETVDSIASRPRYGPMCSSWVIATSLTG
jgi:hypothetical protein